MKKSGPSLATLGCLLAFVIFLIPLPSRAGITEILEPGKLGQVVKDRIAALHIGADVPLFNGEILDGVSTAIKYRYQEEPSYLGNYFTRYDKYSVNLGVNPAAWVEDLQLPFGLGLSSGSEIVFARQFKSQKDALSAVPYTLLHLPVSAERALQKLNVGDFVSFQTNLNLSVSMGASIPLIEALSARGSTGAFLRGEFQVHLFKVTPTKIRVKLIALRGKGVNVAGSLSIAPAPLKIVGFSLVDKKLTKLVTFDPLQLGADAGLNDLFLIDYVFDLTNPDSAKAYDALMQKKLRFKAGALAASLENRAELEQSLITDLSEIESLFHQDAQKPEDQRRVHRIFKGSQESKTAGSRIRVGLNVLRLEADRSFSESRILNLDAQEKESRYLFDSFSSRTEGKLFFNLFRNSEVVHSNLLFRSDENYRPLDFVTLVLAREIQSESLWNGNLGQIKDQIRKTIPEDLFAKIPWEQWSFGWKEIVNLHFRHQLFFKEEALELMPQMDAQAFAASYREFLDGLHARGIHLKTPGENQGNGENSAGDYWLAPSQKYPMQINNVGKILSNVFKRSLDKQIRYRAFVSLKDSQLFLETGAGYLLSLLPKEKLESAVFYQLELSAKGREPVNFSFGENKDRELYDTLIYIQNVLNNRSIDLRLLK